MIHFQFLIGQRKFVYYLHQKIWWAVFSLFPCQIIAQSESDISSLNHFLISDFNKLIEDPDTSFIENLNERQFIYLFNQGLDESFQMLRSNLSPKRLKLHKKRIRISKKLLSKNPFQHPHLQSKIKLGKLGKTKINKNHYGIFADFRGKWYGLWEDQKVNHHWLPPRFTSTSLFQKGQQIFLKSFQTVAIGDGIGWNYTIEYEKRLYLLGYTCHMDQKGEIYLKRPHLGIAQKQNALIWITKNNCYIEHICKSDTCDKLPLHYCISGSYFKRSNDVLPLKLFQSVYLADKTVKRIPFQVQIVFKH